MNNDEDICPSCGAVMYREEANVGVGIIYGPYGCPECPYSEYDYKQATKENPGWWCDKWGCLHNIDRVVEKCEHFGVDGKYVREVFNNDH